jgi:hypothetical protein
MYNFTFFPAEIQYVPLLLLTPTGIPNLRTGSIRSFTGWQHEGVLKDSQKWMKIELYSVAVRISTI